jgi:hypothetical protein
MHLREVSLVDKGERFRSSGDEDCRNVVGASGDVEGKTGREGMETWAVGRSVGQDWSGRECKASAGDTVGCR